MSLTDLANTLAGAYSGYMQAKGHVIHPEWVLGTYSAMVIGETIVQAQLEDSERSLERRIGHRLTANSLEIGLGYLVGQCFGRMFD